MYHYPDRSSRHSAYSLLGQVEGWRLEYGRPIDEPRHPDLASGLPWPLTLTQPTPSEP